ncbi:hypothetical protein ACN20G_23575 [Streptomyces sp. BI20]|uniref:hypothetical protein n=1 Tax=Streptomyces sp. BI20 TaxID=3403460 RepID=UPI003C744FAE
MEEKQIDWAALSDLASKVAAFLVERWHIVEADDVKQAMLEHAYRERKHLVDFADNERFMRKVFYTAGQRYAARERLYLDANDSQYFYTADEARDALRLLIHTDDEFANVLGKHDDLTNCTITDNLFTARMEAKAGLDKLTDRYRELLLRHCVLGLPITNPADRKATSRAAIALSYEMNRSLRRKAARL